jgi:hypothetical protein
MSALKRAVIEEIIDGRREKDRYTINTKLDELSEILNKEDLPEELFKYFPVAIIACLETYFRAAIRDLVDYGSPYIDNCGKIKDLKIDINILKAVQGKNITVGDFISHIIKISSLRQIDQTFSDLLGENFLEALPTATERIITNGETKSSKSDLSNNHREIYKDVEDLFNLRHKIAHEGGATVVLKKSKIQKYIKSVAKLFQATEIIIQNIYYPKGIPMTTYDMRMNASQEYDEVEKEIKRIVEAIKRALKKKEKDINKLFESIEIEPCSGSDYQDFSSLTKAWTNYKNSSANFISNLYARGGTAQPIFYVSEATELSKEILEKYKKYLLYIKEGR